MTRSSRPQREETAETVRVLAVDDDPQALRYVRDALAGAGYQPVVTGDPDEALASWRRSGPGWSSWT